jgi:hypothetical protein
VKICLVDETGTGDGALSVLATRWGLEHDEENLMALVMTPEHLELRKRDEPKLGGIFVDFVGGAMAHRRKFGGGRAKRSLKRLVSRGAICRTWSMRRRDWGVMRLCWRRWLPRADAGAQSGGRGAARRWADAWLR